MSGAHSDQTPSDGIHTPVAFQYANAAARLAASGFDSNDLLKFAHQQDNNTIWMLLTTVPTWAQIGSSGGSMFGADYQTVTSLGRSTTTSTVFQTKLTLTTPVLTGTYRIGWMSVIDQSNGSDAVQARLFNDTDGAIVGAQYEVEPKDTRNRYYAGGFAEIAFSGAAKSFSIQYRQQRGNTAGIQDARIEIWRVG